MLSLRDPQGSVFEDEGRIYRHVTRAAAGGLGAFLASPVGRRLVDQGRVIGTHAVADETRAARPGLRALGDGVLFEHDRVAFPSYPFEWHPAMLADAATATLEVAAEIAADGFTLKDASPFNILFAGARPVLVDVLSIEERRPGYPYWLAEAQYIQSFALPLMAFRRAGITPKQVFLSSRNGLEPQAVARLTRLRDLPGLAHWLYVALPALAGNVRPGPRMQAAYRKGTEMDPSRARFVYESTLERHRALLRKIGRVEARASAWSDYEGRRDHYGADALRAKRDFVENALQALAPRRVLDVGANTGEFSEIACARGAAVVALDADLEAVGMIYARARQKGLDLLPLHVNLGNPSPGTGWQGRETRSLVERASGHFDCLLMLAVIHHLAIVEAIPPAALMQEAAALTTRSLIIEHVGPEDPMCRALLRGRDYLAARLTRDAFETAVSAHFQIESREPLASGSRALYVCRRKS